MLLSREVEATEPRDNIYALLDLASYGKLLVQPNYEKYEMPDAKVLMELTHAFLTQQSNLRVIVLRSVSRAPNENLPSWVPVWNQLSISRLWLHEVLFRPWDEKEGVDVHGTIPQIIQRIGDVLSVFTQQFRSTNIDSYTFDNDRLKVKGVILDVIDGISSQPLKLHVVHI